MISTKNYVEIECAARVNAVWWYGKREVVNLIKFPARSRQSQSLWLSSKTVVIKNIEAGAVTVVHRHGRSRRLARLKIEKAAPSFTFASVLKA